MSSSIGKVSDCTAVVNAHGLYGFEIVTSPAERVPLRLWRPPLSQSWKRSPAGPRRQDAAVPPPRQGNLATIGRAAAVADIKALKLSGFSAWIAWLLVHLWHLVEFQNRILVSVRWSFSFATHGRGACWITEPGVESNTGSAPQQTTATT